MKNGLKPYKVFTKKLSTGNIFKQIFRSIFSHKNITFIIQETFNTKLIKLLTIINLIYKLIQIG